MPIKTYLSQSAGLDMRDPINMSGEMLLDDCENIQLSSRGDTEGRKGFQAKGGFGGYGTFEHIYSNDATNLINEALVVDDQLKRLDTGYITIGYTGSYSNINVTILPSGGNYRLIIVENGVTLLNRNLGRGYEESSSDTITSTVAAIDALANITCVLSVGDGTVSSAFLDLTTSLHISSGLTKTIGFVYPTTIYSPASSPFLSLSLNKGTSLLENVAGVSFNNLLFLADKGNLKAYDGQSLYKAGLPPPPAPSYSTTADYLTGEYIYYVSYEYTDTRGKRTESELSPELDLILTSQAPILTLKTLNSDSGYNTDCAVVNGTQSLTPSSGQVTITVGNGTGGAHT